MAFPASLATKTVTGSFSTYPNGTAAAGTVTFTNANWLFSGTDNEIIAPFAAEVTLDGSGNFSVVLPATDDPQWTPQGWEYTVAINVGGGSLPGSIALPYDGGDVDLADVFNPTAPLAGESYILLSSRSAAGGVAGLDVDGDVIDADGVKITGGGGGTGDVVGPASAVTGNFVTFNGTTGKLVADSGMNSTTVANQIVDLYASKANLASPTFTGTVAGITKAMVGLGNVDNTADASKTFAQSQVTNLTTDLAAKAALASPTFTGTPSLPTGTTAVTQTAGNSATLLATTAFVTTADNLKAPLASPTFTGTPAAPTATIATRTTQLSTTAHTWTVVDAVSNYVTSGEEILSRDQTMSEVAMAAGSLHLSYFTARKTETINNTITGLGATVGASNTLARIGVYSVDGSGNLTLVASTTNLATLWQTANSNITRALTASWSKVAGTRYAVGLLVVGGTPPSPIGIFPHASLSSLAPRTNGIITSQTDLQASYVVGLVANDFRKHQVVFTP